MTVHHIQNLRPDILDVNASHAKLFISCSKYHSIWPISALHDVFRTVSVTKALKVLRVS